MEKTDLDPVQKRIIRLNALKSLNPLDKANSKYVTTIDYKEKAIAIRNETRIQRQITEYKKRIELAMFCAHGHPAYNVDQICKRTYELISTKLIPDRKIQLSDYKEFPKFKIEFEEILRKRYLDIVANNNNILSGRDSVTLLKDCCKQILKSKLQSKKLLLKRVSAFADIILFNARNTAK